MPETSLPYFTWEKLIRKSSVHRYGLQGYNELLDVDYHKHIELNMIKIDSLIHRVLQSSLNPLETLPSGEELNSLVSQAHVLFLLIHRIFTLFTETITNPTISVKARSKIFVTLYPF